MKAKLEYDERNDCPVVRCLKCRECYYDHSERKWHCAAEGDKCQNPPGKLFQDELDSIGIREG